MLSSTRQIFSSAILNNNWKKIAEIFYKKDYSFVAVSNVSKRFFLTNAFIPEAFLFNSLLSKKFHPEVFLKCYILNSLKKFTKFLDVFSNFTFL